MIEALRLKGDPVLAMVEINNESSLLYSFQTGALKKYWPEATLDEVIARDKAYLDRIAAAVREALGPSVPVTGTQVEFGGPFIFDTHASLDYIDEHFYIDHYNFPNRPWDQTDWRIRDSSGAGSGYLQYLHKAFARQANKPFTVSEFNQPYPNRQAAELDPTLAAFAAFQDWDGVMHFAYSHGRNWNRNAPSGFDLDGDFTKLAAFGQAAYIFRKGLVRPAEREFIVPLPRALREKATAERMQFQLARFFESVGVDPKCRLHAPRGCGSGRGDFAAAGPGAAALPRRGRRHHLRPAAPTLSDSWRAGCGRLRIPAPGARNGRSG